MLAPFFTWLEVLFMTVNYRPDLRKKIENEVSSKSASRLGSTVDTDSSLDPVLVIQSGKRIVEMNRATRAKAAAKEKLKAQ